MSLTLGLTGMDPATEAALKATFIEANVRLGGRWSLVPDAEAGHVVVDMDSMYGPMSWLRLHAAGRQVIGLTSAPRTQTDYRLGRPFDTAQLAELLASIERAAGGDVQAPAVGDPDATAPADTPADAPAAEAAPAQPPVAEAAQAPAVETVEEPAEAPADTPDAVPPAEPAAGPAAESARGPGPGPAAAFVDQAATNGMPEASSAPDAPVPAPPPAAAPTEGTLAAWLQPGALEGRFRFGRSAGPTLLIDTAADAWFGPTPLKPTAGYFGITIRKSEFEPLDDAAWDRETAGAGEAQPLSRLRWLGGLLAGGGALLPGVDPEGRFQLLKWPQTEREYPRHFRIATQMMKGPATLAGIAEASGVPEADVADFINANLATGFAAAVVEAPEPPVEPAKPRGGLLGRLRNR
ncbi:MAG: hypothetical protein GX856_01260 [Gammaproteobacteria bacterium]|jgi:hypothetical protein|nr:hypothetical protein [Gammaproteobacteria bacterium]